MACLNGSVGVLSAGNDSNRQFDGTAGWGRAVHVVPRNGRTAGGPTDGYRMRVVRVLLGRGKPTTQLSAPGQDR